MVKLEKLCLKRNLLKTMPELKELKELLEIDLSENEFSRFPESIISLEKIQKINLNMNNLDTLNYPIRNSTIQYLYLSNNQFKEIFPDILNLTALKHVSLDGNQIAEIKDTMFKDIPSSSKFYIGISGNLLKQDNIYGNIFEVPIKGSKETHDAVREDIKYLF